MSCSEEDTLDFYPRHELGLIVPPVPEDHLVPDAKLSFLGNPTSEQLLLGINSCLAHYLGDDPILMG